MKLRAISGSGLLVPNDQISMIANDAERGLLLDARFRGGRCWCEGWESEQIGFRAESSRTEDG